MSAKKLPTAALIAQYDPHRSPRWRYERALKLLKRGEGPKRNHDDEAIIAIRKLLADHTRIMRHTRSPGEIRDNLLMQYAHNPGLYYAFESFYYELGTMTRYELEARILAGQTNEEIAEVASTQPDTVEWYEKLFFHVRDRLGNQGYIRNQVIWPAIVGSLDEITLDMTLKFFGFFGGPVVLEHVICMLDKARAVKPTAGASTDQFFENLSFGNLGWKTGMGTTFMEVNKFNVMPLIEQYRLLTEHITKTKEEGGQLNPVEQSVKVFLAQLPWSVGQERQNALAKTPFESYYGHAGEPRAFEIARIAQGQVIDTAPLMKALPPPPLKESIDGVEQGS